MAYNKKNSFGGNKTNNKFINKPITMVLPLAVSGVDGRGNEYDASSAFNLMSDLQIFDVFTKLSVDVTLAKSVCFNDDEAKGTISVARLQSYNPETNEVSITFFGKNTKYADKITSDMVVVPKVRTARDSTEVITIVGFEIMYR